MMHQTSQQQTQDPTSSPAPPNISASASFVIAWKKLSEEYQQLGCSLRTINLFADSLKQWAVCAIYEQSIRSLTTATTCRWKQEGEDLQQLPSFDELVRLRTVTVGIRHVCVLLERSSGFEVPDEIVKNPLFQQVIDLSSLIIGLFNDLCSAGKDHLLQPNLLLYLHYGGDHVLGPKLEFDSASGKPRRPRPPVLFNSFECIVRLHNRAVREFDTYSKQLIDQVDTHWKERLSYYLTQVRYMTTGFMKWHSESHRYQRTVITQGLFYVNVQLKPTDN